MTPDEIREAPPYTADQLETGIGNALAARDVVAAVEMLRVLAGVDARRADLVLKTMEVGLAIAEVPHDENLRWWAGDV